MSTLVCLPFAGGSDTSYTFLRHYLPPHIRLKVLEYPGRGRRISSPPLECLDALVDDALLQLQNMYEDDYILYGHSLGACVAFLLAERVTQSFLPPPKHLVLSGHGTIAERQRRQRHLLPADQFFSLLAEMQGTPPEVLACKELLEFFEPVLRADFAVLDNFQRTDFSPLPYSFTVLHGADDTHTTRDSVTAWEKLCLGDFDFHEFPGGHFFIREHPKTLARVMTGVTLA